MMCLPILGMHIHRGVQFHTMSANLQRREKNMFSFTSSQAHKQRRRIIAAAYSKPAVSHYRVQAIVEIRVAKLLKSVNNLSGNGEVLASSTRPLVVRNLFRALQADIFTAFAFSEQEGTTFLDDLRVGPNTMEDLGMGMMDLCHDEKRDMYFFWESEKPFKYIAQLLDRNGPIAHRKAQDWLAGLARKFEERVQLTIGPDHPRQNAGGFDQGVYSRLLRWKDDTGRHLSFKERVSEIMDHTSTSCKIRVVHAR